MNNLQKAIYFSEIFDIYPKSEDAYFQKKDNFENYDLEGDLCKITHWMPEPNKPDNVF